jgi:hypothetical protein
MDLLASTGLTLRQALALVFSGLAGAVLFAFLRLRRTRPKPAFDLDRH